MVSAAEQLAANLNFGGARQSRRAQEAHLVHGRRAAGLSPGHLYPAARHRSGRLGADLQHPGRRHPRHVQHVLRRRHPPDGDLRAQHHAVHLGLDHHPVDDDGLAHARSAQEGRRVGPQDHEPVHPVSHRGAGRVPVLRHRASACKAPAASSATRVLLPDLDHDHAHRRHHVPDVAGRADHRARHRQRHFADHPGRHRRANCRRRSPARSNSAARARCPPG